MFSFEVSGLDLAFCSLVWKIVIDDGKNLHTSQKTNKFPSSL